MLRGPGARSAPFGIVFAVELAARGPPRGRCRQGLGTRSRAPPSETTSSGSDATLVGSSRSASSARAARPSSPPTAAARAQRTSSPPRRRAGSSFVAGVFAARARSARRSSTSASARAAHAARPGRGRLARIAPRAQGALDGARGGLVAVVTAAAVVAVDDRRQELEGAGRVSAAGGELGGAHAEERTDARVDGGAGARGEGLVADGRVAERRGRGFEGEPRRVEIHGRRVHLRRVARRAPCAFGVVLDVPEERGPHEQRARALLGPLGGAHARLDALA